MEAEIKPEIRMAVRVAERIVLPGPDDANTKMWIAEIADEIVPLCKVAIAGEKFISLYYGIGGTDVEIADARLALKEAVDRLREEGNVKGEHGR